MATAMGSDIGLEGGVCNSHIHSAVGSSGPVCTMSIRAGDVGVLSSNACLSSSARSLTTLPTMVLTNTSLDAGEVATRRVLGEQGRSGPTSFSISRVGSDGPVGPVWKEFQLWPPFPNLSSSGSHLRYPGDSPRLREAPPIVVR